MRLDPAVAATRRAVRAALSSACEAGELEAGALVLAAVSGGPDSLALAAALAREGPRLGLRAGAVTVDHGLQPGSAARVAAVVRRCAELGLEPALDVAVSVGRAGGPEGAARTARYDGLLAAAAQQGADALLLGHTLDDQAETVLLGLARGSGARSLSGMAASTAATDGRLLLRPFLGLRRPVTRAACAALGLDAWDDPDNLDRRLTRSRVRHDLLPALEEALGPGVAEALARTARLLRADAEALDAWAASASGDLTGAGLAALPGAVRRRVLRAAAIAAGAAAGDLTAGHVAAMDALVTSWRGQGPVSLPGGLVAERLCDRLSFR
jgi:tRNA(Ile)-lysidine synthase